MCVCTYVYIMRAFKYLYSKTHKINSELAKIHLQLFKTPHFAETEMLMENIDNWLEDKIKEKQNRQLNKTRKTHLIPKW